ncbi:hypothetical protein [Glaciibacter sp. 2TAF33]|uniref:hypothetical protein n=1 Tax=Glaciibacter sp. 2TAF33 TaxID=3233015 RepID=UPI003F8F0398
MPEIVVTLMLSDGSKALTRVPTNRHCQLPAVIVDPRDNRGRVISGTWLGDSKDGRLDGSEYQPVPVRSSAFDARSGARI